MVSRTTRTVVCFSSTFGLPDVDGPQAAGSYRVDHDEELIESVSQLAWRRVASFIYLPGIGQHGMTHQMVPINRADLDAALEKDKSHDQIPPLFSVTPIPSATKPRRIFSRRGKLSG